MTPQEAIQGLLQLKDEIDMAIKALKLHTPQKPSWVFDDEPLCPNCQAVIDWGQEMCDECTQLIDWSDTE